MTEATCNECNIKFKYNPSNSFGKFCSMKCYGDSLKGKPSWNKGKKLSLEHKKNMSLSRKEGLKKGTIKNPMKGKKWSNSMREKLSGKNSYNWKGGISSLNKRLRTSIRFKEWRERVFKRDNYTCQKCHIKGGILHPHHIVPLAECLAMNFKEMIFMLINGLTLCKSCHQEKHRGVRFV